ncbi:MAG: hypothetical protein ACRCWO_05685 [Bosea sp. (in: a-proteobacteria)]
MTATPPVDPGTTARLVFAIGEARRARAKLNSAMLREKTSPGNIPRPTRNWLSIRLLSAESGDGFSILTSMRSSRAPSSKTAGDWAYARESKGKIAANEATTASLIHVTGMLNLPPNANSKSFGSLFNQRAASYSLMTRTILQKKHSRTT